MERKKALIPSLIVTLLLSGIAAALAGFQPGTGETTKINLYDAADPTASPVLYPDGQQYIELNDTYTVGDTFTVTANVTSVDELNMYQVGVEYNSTILDVTSFSEGATDQNFFYLNVPAAAYAPVINKPQPASGTGGPMFGGDWNHVTWALKKPYNASGTGVLAVFDFEVLDYGFTYIDIMIAGAQVAVLGDPNAPPDENYNTIDIIFDNLGLIPAAHGPTADFTIAPPAPRYVNQVLTFTGKNTSSEWGFTGYPDLEYCPIVLFEWDFMSVANPRVYTAQGQQVQFAYPTNGTFYVNLTVTDTRGWKGWATKDVTIFPLAVGATLDVYTQQPVYNGTGPYMPSRPYRANEEKLVQLFAEVVDNNCPMENRSVVFSVFQASGVPPSMTFIPVIIRTAFTDINGIANIGYGIPTGYYNESHGAYFVYAYCFIANALVVDALTYRVEWINEIVSAVPIAPQSWHKGETAVFNVTILSWDFIPLPVTISLSIYDDLNCTIARTMTGPESMYYSPTRTFFGDGTQLGLYGEYYTGPGVDWFLIGAHIPMNAFVGVGTAYVNIFDAWPIPDMFAELLGLTGDGQPYCPEVSTSFGIEC